MKVKSEAIQNYDNPTMATIADDLSVEAIDSIIAGCETLTEAFCALGRYVETLRREVRIRRELSMGQIRYDDPGYRVCDCEDYPCCGH